MKKKHFVESIYRKKTIEKLKKKNSYLGNNMGVDIYVFLNNFGFSLGLGMPILIILTSDSVNVVCCDPPASGRLCKSSAKRNIVCGGYLLLMLLILTGVFLHCNPADNSWMKWISWLAGLGLCCQMI